MNYLVLIGRILFAAIFIMSGLMSHLFGYSKAAVYAAANGVPAPALAVIATGIMILAGGLSVLLGYKARIGAWLLVIFLVPTTLIMHRFWGLSDPMAAGMQQAMFMKNLSMLGGALLIAYFGSGPLSLDASEAGVPSSRGG